MRYEPDPHGMDSIPRVTVLSVTKPMRLTKDNVRQTLENGAPAVYLIYNRRSESYRRRRYCHIGRTIKVRSRMYGHIRWHARHPDQCRDGDRHWFQVLVCSTLVDAARLEALFHVWHGNYPNLRDREPLEGKHRPRAAAEPDFFEVVR